MLQYLYVNERANDGGALSRYGHWSLGVSRLQDFLLPLGRLIGRKGLKQGIRMTSSKRRTLVLNTDWTPLTTWSWKRAIRYEVMGKEMPGEGVRTIQYYEDGFILSAGGEEYPQPAVVVSNRYVNKHKLHPPLSKRNLAIRDSMTCQYCGIKLDRKTFTVDHVIPKRMFTKTSDANTWCNVVASCRPCNVTKKRGRTPQQAGMKLLTIPVAPCSYEIATRFHPWEDPPPEWLNYIKYDKI